MPLLETKGAASSQGFGEFSSSTPAVYIEDVFSTYLYTGNSTSGGTQTVTNNIDLSTKGGLVWIKGRSAASNHILTDTTRGAGASATNNNALASNLTDAEDLGGSSYDFLSSFSTTGFVVTQGGTTTATRGTNYNAVTYVSWTFRKQAKFFDVVTWTGDGVQNRAVPHNLGTTPGCIIIKRLNAAQDWDVWHRSANAAWTGGTTAGDVTGGNQTGSMNLNTTGAFNSSWGIFTYVNSTAFGVYYNNLEANVNGETYVAYLFAHDAGGFGTSGSDNVISCGSFTTDGSGLISSPVSLGYEPQWLMVKRTDSTSEWSIVDTMRGFFNESSGVDRALNPNLSNAESNAGFGTPTATGFGNDAGTNGYFASATYIYIAIRRGPMKVPTSGTQVYNGVLVNSSASAQTIDATFPSDLTIKDYRNLVNGAMWFDRLRGYGSANSPRLLSYSTDAEASSSDVYAGGQTTVTEAGIGTGYTSVDWFFRRAPGFFDVVCFTTVGGGIQTITHSLLGVPPELVIVKRRSGAQEWHVLYSAGSGLYLVLQSTVAADDGATPGTFFTSTGAGYTAPTATTIWMNNLNAANDYVAYLFATCPGVSKVGTYTGTGTTLQIDCGFTGGARFILIKRTDSTGDWYVYDSARGIVSGDDPYLFLNSTAAEVTNTDYVDTYNAGFELSSTAPAGLNANGGTYIFLAIA